MSVDVGTASFDAIGIGGIGWVWPFSMALMLDASFQLDLLWFILSYQGRIRKVLPLAKAGKQLQIISNRKLGEKKRAQQVFDEIAPPYQC